MNMKNECRNHKYDFHYEIMIDKTNKIYRLVLSMQNAIFISSLSPVHCSNH